MINTSRRGFMTGVCAAVLAARIKAVPAFEAVSNEWHHYTLRFQSGKLIRATIDNAFVDDIRKVYTAATSIIAEGDGTVLFWAKRDGGAFSVNDIVVEELKRLTLGTKDNNMTWRQ